MIKIITIITFSVVLIYFLIKFGYFILDYLKRKDWYNYWLLKYQISDEICYEMYKSEKNWAILYGMIKNYRLRKTYYLILTKVRRYRQQKSMEN